MRSSPSARRALRRSVSRRATRARGCHQQSVFHVRELGSATDSRALAVLSDRRALPRHGEGVVIAQHPLASAAEPSKPGDPPALPGRHPKFDNSGSLGRPPLREPVKHHKREVRPKTAQCRLTDAESQACGRTPRGCHQLGGVENGPIEMIRFDPVIGPWKESSEKLRLVTGGNSCASVGRDANSKSSRPDSATSLDRQ